MATPTTSTNIDGVNSNVSLTVSATQNPSIANYIVRYGINNVDYTQTFFNLQTVSDALGEFKIGQYLGGSPSNLYLFNLDTALSDSLDFVQVAAYERETSDQAAEMAFLVYGKVTSTADMPTTGTAQFSGDTRGLYIPKGGNLYLTRSQISLDANFASGSVSGSTSNFKVMDASTGNIVNRSENLNFIYSGSIRGRSPHFSGTALSALPSSAGGLNITGNVEGAFFGPAGQAPDEAGLTYKLGTPITDAFMTGGAVLGKQ